MEIIKAICNPVRVVNKEQPDTIYGLLLGALCEHTSFIYEGRYDIH